MTLELGKVPRKVHPHIDTRGYLGKNDTLARKGT